MVMVCEGLDGDILWLRWVVSWCVRQLRQPRQLVPAPPMMDAK